MLSTRAGSCLAAGAAAKTDMEKAATEARIRVFFTEVLLG
jgi:hypothetical protein